MTIPLISVLLQSISSLAIAGGFIFAAIQLRQTRNAQHVANFSRLVEMQMSLRRIRVEHPELASVHTHDIADLPTERDIQDYFLNLMQLSLFEIAWYAHRQGQLSDDYFASWEHRMHALCTETSFQKMMAKPGMKIMHDDFHAYLQAMMARNLAAKRLAN
jgi:hypothetical protein